MPTSTDIHVGDVGTVFLVTIVEDDAVVNLSSGSITNYIKFKKPDGTSASKIALFHTNGTDGIIKYISEEGFLDMAGTWYISALVNLPSGRWTATAQDFVVRSDFT